MTLAARGWLRTLGEATADEIFRRLRDPGDPYWLLLFDAVEGGLKFQEDATGAIYRERMIAFKQNVLTSNEADTWPLRSLLEKYIDRDILEGIAEEYGKGRLLFIATTDLDSRRAVVWNIGAIAQSGDPKALTLFHNILVASAAIPGAFPPVMMDVEIDGTKYHEMHVDGGAISQTFSYPSSVKVLEITGKYRIFRQRTLYVIRNARLDPVWSSVKRQTLDIAGRAISSLINSEGIGDLYKIFVNTRRDHIDYNLAFIPKDFTEEAPSDFYNPYMRALFDFAYQRARRGYVWHKFPPGYAPEG